MAVVKLLKNLCQIRQVAAALVIHQPSGELFELFDSLVLLSSGKCVFSGSLEGLPDFYRDTFKTDYPAQHMVPNRLLKEATAGEAEGFFDEDVLEQIHRQGLLETKALTSRPRIPPTTWVVFTTVFTRNLTNHYVRNLGNVAARILLYTALSAIDGAIFWQVAQPESEGGALPLASSLVVIGAFTFLIMISFLLPFAMIPIFVFDKKFFAAESALGLYSPIIYCISQALLETWILTICALCEACVIIPMGGFWNPVLPRWGAFFTVCGSLIASGLAGSGLVLVCTMVFPSQDLAFLAGSGVVTVALGVSGGFVPFPSMEDWISWLQWVSPCKYSLQALAIGQFGNSNSEIILEVSALNTPNSVSANIGVLLGFYVVFTVGTVLALSRQREVR
uniref:ABC-2 type transporter transmembrane domain-containing protein n=1 Tax=Attheya septentrionalis TaxID=420275 RepID=A0A7S2XRR9_9STRA|mmetsp:Transcript_3570/g.6517  ORF Transcript_3570/g.6517 Transcript_3570/m.6517 type:complete len:392 (+) Transcript_3570:331-1506(+)